MSWFLRSIFDFFFRWAPALQGRKCWLVAKKNKQNPRLNGCFWFPSKVGSVAYNLPIGSIYHLYTTYILPSGRLYATYHLLVANLASLRITARDFRECFVRLFQDGWFSVVVFPLKSFFLPNNRGPDSLLLTLNKIQLTGCDGQSGLGGNSNIFYFHPYPGKWSNLTNIFQMGNPPSFWGAEFCDDRGQIADEVGNKFNWCQRTEYTRCCRTGPINLIF